MTAHDPLCTYGPEFDRMVGHGQCPECDLIALIRADLRAEVAGLPCIIMDCSELAMNHRHAVRLDDVLALLDEKP